MTFPSEVTLPVLGSGVQLRICLPDSVQLRSSRLERRRRGMLQVRPAERNREPRQCHMGTVRGRKPRSDLYLRGPA